MHRLTADNDTDELNWCVLVVQMGEEYYLANDYNKALTYVVLCYGALDYAIWIPFIHWHLICQQKL